MNFHQFTNDENEVLILRRIPQDRKTHNGFLWPHGVGATVECPDWNSQPKCGGGLHGWPLGFGLGDGCDYDIINDIWLVVGCKPDDVVGELEGDAKCKFRTGTIRLEGSFGDAMAKVAPLFALCVAEMAKESNGYSSRSAANGNSSKSAANGNYSRSAANGDSSQSAANGYYSQSAANGDYSKSAANGNYSRSAANGNSSKSAANGNYSQSAANGYYSQSAANGNYSRSAANGDYSRSAANGDYSRSAANGDYSKCEALGGNNCAAIVGHGGTIRVGNRGAFALPYYTEADGWRFLCGKVGEDGIKADTWYTIRNGKLVEVEKVSQ